MKKKINIQLAVYTVLGLVVNFIILKWLQKDFLVLLLSHFYFIIYTLLLFYYIEKTKENNRQFVSAFMGIFGAKLFISSVIVAVYLFLATDEKEIFAINFFAIYFYYSVFEVVKSYRLLKSI